MKDKNGTEIKTGDIVKTTGAYFDGDNGLWFVENSPGDPSWIGSDHSLRKISKAGKISTAKRNICFWPICVFISDRSKAAEARRWNAEHAEIEVVAIKNMAEVAAHFEAEAAALDEHIKRARWDFGENSPEVERLVKLQAHYRAVATRKGGEARG